MTGAKSALEVKDNMTFLDLTVRQIEHLNTTEHVDVPLILMTSFNTHEDTLRIIKNTLISKSESLPSTNRGIHASLRGHYSLVRRQLRTTRSTGTPLVTVTCTMHCFVQVTSIS